MGYPMTYGRVISRNDLTGNYLPKIWSGVSQSLIAGDLRRLERDQRDDYHLKEYAKRTKLTEAQVLHVLDLLFEGNF